MNNNYLTFGIAALGAWITATGSVNANPVAAAGYSVSVWAAGPGATSGADSVEVVGNSVYVGYSNGTPKDGTAGNSTIVQYTLTGSVVNSVSVPGHTDGLRYDPGSGMLWSMQNEDANPNLVLINPASLAKSPTYTFSSVPHGGGYDDAVFVGGKAFVTASNPSASPNTSAALSQAVLDNVNHIVNVTGVLNGNAAATPLTGSSPTTLNLQDPDSLSLTQSGKIVLDSQADGQLVFVANPATTATPVSVLQLNNGVLVDDTVFAGNFNKTLLVADKTTNAVYAITGPFAFDTGYSAAQDANLAGFVGALDANGNYTQIVTGLGNPAGEAFLAPEPASIALLGSGLFGLIGLRRARRQD
jgi:hypothetical protein